MELTPNDMKKLCLVRPRVATTKTTNKPHIFLHSLEQSKEAKQRKRDRWRRGASSLLPPPSPGGGPLGPSPTLLSSRSLTRPRASRPPSSKAYDYRIVDHTVICHAAAVALPSFLRLGTPLRGSRSQSHRRADATPEENRLGSRRARANGRRTSSVSGGTHRVEWSNYRHKFLTGSSDGRFELHVITRPNRTRLTWNTTRRSWDAAASR